MSQLLKELSDADIPGIVELIKYCWLAAFPPHGRIEFILQIEFECVMRQLCSNELWAEKISLTALINQLIAMQGFMCFLRSAIATRRIREGFVPSICVFQCVLAACLLAVINTFLH